MSTRTEHRLEQSIGLGRGTALYVSAILGAGVLVLPGQVASLAGPASLLAWAFSCLLGIPLAKTFAALAVAHPDAGGVSTYATLAFGRLAGGIAGWWYFIAGAVGQTIVPLTGGYYVAAAAGLSRGWAFVFAGAILGVAVLANVAGIRVSGRVQIGLALAVGVVLLVAAVASIPSMDSSRLQPFAPHGAAGIGQAAVVLFFAFAGWEAVAHLAAEFTHPGRDLPRATAITIGVVTVLYLGIAVAVVLTGTYGRPETDHVAIGLLLQGAVGLNATIGAAVVAVVISLGTTNAFMASISRLGYALARDGWLPRPFARISARSVPVGGVALVAAIGGGGLVLAALAHWGTEQLVLVPSTLVIVVYLLGAASGVRLLAGRARLVSAVTAVLTACALPFAGRHLLIAVVIALGAMGYRLATRRQTRRQTRKTVSPAAG